MSELAKVMRQDGRGMITLRGDLASPKLKAALKAACGQGVPPQGQMVGTTQQGAAWMSPDELLVMVPYGDVASCLAKLEDSLGGTHFLAVDVSDARAVFSITGSDPREVLARLSPADLHPSAFGAGLVRRSRIGQVAAAFWMQDAGIDVVCFRSVADYVQRALVNAAGATKTGAFDG